MDGQTQRTLFTALLCWPGVHRDVQGGCALWGSEDYRKQGLLETYLLISIGDGKLV